MHEEVPDMRLFCYVCLSFFGLSDKRPGSLLIESGDFSMLWLMKRTIMSTDEPIKGKPGGPTSYVWRSVEFRSTMNHLAIPGSGIAFFTLFVLNAKEIWKKVLVDAKLHLAKRVGLCDKRNWPITDCELSDVKF